MQWFLREIRTPHTTRSRSIKRVSRVTVPGNVIDIGLRWQGTRPGEASFDAKVAPIQALNPIDESS